MIKIFTQKVHKMLLGACLLLIAMPSTAQQWVGSVNSAGDIWRMGNVRIGANGSNLTGVKLQIDGGDLFVNSSQGGINLGYPSGDGWQFNTINGGEDIQLFSDPAVGSSVRRFVIRQGGNVGFNIFPETVFDMYSPTEAIAEMRLQGGRPGVFTPSRFSFFSDARGSATEWRPGFIQTIDNGNFTGGLAFYTNGTGIAERFGALETMRLVNGRVGIGNTSPNYPLHLTANATVGIQYDGPASGFAGIYMNGGQPFYGYKQGGLIEAYHYLDSEQNLRFWINGTNRAVLTSEGALGIGILEPERPIHLRATNAIFRIDRDRDDPGFAIVRYDNGFNNVWKSFYFYTRGTGVNQGKFIIADWATNVTGPSTARLVIANNGNVGIGDFLFTDPSQKLTVSGNVLATGSFITSDKRFKKNIQSIPSAMERLNQLKGVSYAYETEKFAARNLPEGKNIGFIAQEVEKIFPELVVKDGEGYLAVNYDGLIPVLVEALKAQQQRIEALEAKLTANTTLQEENPSLEGINTPLLYQNHPNPFHEKTEIRFFLPDETTQATLFIYDMQGTQIKKMEIVQRGESSVELQAGSLKAGMYYYSLIANGQEVSMKRMMITD